MFQANHVVEYSDLDASGFVYFANFVRFMEETEYKWLRSRGLSVVLSDDKGSLGFPRLKAEFEVVENVQLGARLSINMTIAPCNGKQLEYSFDIRRENQQVVTGTFLAACCRFPNNGMPYAIPIPDWVMENMFGETVN